MAIELIEETPYRWRIPASGRMRVPGIVFASKAVLPELAEDQSLQQVADVATLPGIVEASYVMPDVHWGYGFPIGGVAATDVDAGGVISPGGVGFDISCGVRLLASDVMWDEVKGESSAVMDALAHSVPHGMGKGGIWRLDGEDELDRVLAEGAPYAVAQGYGVQRDVDRCEDRGMLADADPAGVGERARARGLHQVGSLGSGNHFLEVQVVDQVLDEAKAEAFGLREGRVCVMIHCGSRGLGHQVCTDHLKTMQTAMQRYGIEVPDRQLACVPVRSPEGRAYLQAMNAAANYGRANRQLIGEAVRRAFDATLDGATLDLVYDLSHNMAKLEEHVVDGKRKLLCVHRKGATRALPPGHDELPADLKPHGQPVMVPGSMGTASWVLAGVEGGGAFNSTCHGAGRTMSRTQAKKRIRGDELRNELEGKGIRIRAGSMRGLAEEAPFAYKDVDAVVETCEQAGLCARVARLRPVGVVKG